MPKDSLPRKNTRSRRLRKKLNPEVFSLSGQSQHAALETQPDRSALRNPTRMLLFLQLWKLERREIPKNSVPGSAAHFVRLFRQPVRSQESRRGSALKTRRIRRLHLHLRPRLRWTPWTPRAPTTRPQTTRSPMRSVSGARGPPGRTTTIFICVFIFMFQSSSETSDLKRGRENCVPSSAQLEG